ncbi:MAG: helix-turn-helix transcriptional regulator [Opitutales bacterium]|nr:helix-turn-helix transcriptional regulator [Opitutales bacterium]MCH8539571.1 AraC family transcriptional regulator [Opitutales bacterium]
MKYAMFTETDKLQDYPQGDYAPHVLSGAEARRQSGRRTPGLNRPSGYHPWYTTYVIDQGPFTIREAGGNVLSREGPTVICLPPYPEIQIQIPASTLYSWLEWGAIRLPLCVRDKINASRKYPEGYRQPSPEEVWGRPLPLQLPEHTNQATAGMMIRVNATWWKGGADRMLANAELALWIARYLFPPEVNENQEEVKSLFPSAENEFMQAVQLLSESLAMGLDIRDWALALGLSARSLQRWCRQQCDLSPHGVLDLLRLQRAETLLTKKEDNLPLIAKKCGFASASAFSAWFSRRKGLSPARWRAGFREKARE